MAKAKAGCVRDAFPRAVARENFSKSKIRKIGSFRVETPAYLRGSWEYAGRKPRCSRCPAFEVALFYTYRMPGTVQLKGGL
jgi:hypothetical protein